MTSGNISDTLINLLSSGKEALHILALTVVLAQKIMKKNSFFYGQNKYSYTENSLELLQINSVFVCVCVMCGGCVQFVAVCGYMHMGKGEKEKAAFNHIHLPGMILANFTTMAAHRQE